MHLLTRELAGTTSQYCADAGSDAVIRFVAHVRQSGPRKTAIEWESGPPAAAGVFALLRSPAGHLQLRMLPAADESTVSEVSQSPIPCIWPPVVLARLQLPRQNCSREIQGCGVSSPVSGAMTAKHEHLSGTCHSAVAGECHHRLGTEGAAGVDERSLWALQHWHAAAAATLCIGDCPEIQQNDAARYKICASQLCRPSRWQLNMCCLGLQLCKLRAWPLMSRKEQHSPRSSNSPKSAVLLVAEGLVAQLPTKVDVQVDNCNLGTGAVFGNHVSFEWQVGIFFIAVWRSRSNLCLQEYGRGSVHSKA